MGPQGDVDRLAEPRDAVTGTCEDLPPGLRSHAWPSSMGAWRMASGC
jgi:hypothetical protein